MSQEKGKNETFVEITKAMIGCGSAVAAACVTGVFALLAVFGPRLTTLFSDTPTAIAVTVVAPTPLVVMPTAPASSTAKITNAVMAQDVKSVTFDPIGVTTTYSADQGVFHAVVSVVGATKDTEVKAVWTAVDVGSVVPPNTEIDEVALNISGSKNIDFALTPPGGGQRWPLGRYSGPAWPPGKYKVEIYLNGKLDRMLDFAVAGEATKPVGSPIATSTELVGTLGSIVFAPGITGVEPTKKPVDAATRFPEGVTKVYTVFPFQGTLKGSQWRWERYLDGKVQPELAGVGWDLTGQGNGWILLWNDNGVTPGEWEFRLYLMDKLVQKGTFTIEKRQVNAPYFGAVRFAEGIKDDKPVNLHKATDVFKAGTKEVYAFFEVGNMTKGLKWKTEWYYNGELVKGVGGTQTWTADESVKEFWLSLLNISLSGTFELKVYIEDKLVQLGTFVIE